MGDRDAFCGSCGAAQPGAPAPGASRPPGGAAAPGPSFAPGLTASTASVLCYTPYLGWIMSIVVLASESYRRDLGARFHAFQGLFLFVAYQIVDKVLGPTVLRYLHFPPAGLLKLALLGICIWMMVATSRGEKIRLPLLGDLAEKATAEQI